VQSYNEMPAKFLPEVNEKSSSHGETWTVWPESSFFLNPKVDQDYTSVAALLKNKEKKLLHFFGSIEIRNSKATPMFAAVNSNNKILGVHGKIHPFPIGEYIPGESFFPFLKNFAIQKNMVYNDKPVFIPHPDPDGPIFIPLICYESVLFDYVDNLVKEAQSLYPNRPLIFVEINNNMWFGKTSAAHYHALVDRVQVARFGLPMMRAGMTSHSEIIAPWGETLKSSKPFEKDIIFADLPVKKL
jgi:apolipoprotein N-acyltransferase